MPGRSLTPRLIFVVFFVVQCLLWSRSRYAIHSAPTSSLLVRRFEPAEKECGPIAFPPSEQCPHVSDVCPASTTFLSINYLKHYFCANPSVRPAIFAALLLWLVFLFSTLGISASDFFTPNLATIAQLLGLDENVAGVTFLAFGNGSPDVFATFSAMRANSGSLAIGELLGAATFITSCVVGSICVIKPFRVNPRPFLRDVGFFTIAVSLLLVILWDGTIHFWEAALMVVLYLFYVAFVVIGTFWEKRLERKRLSEAIARAEYRDDEVPGPPPEFFEPYRDDPSTPMANDTLSLPIPSPNRARALSTPDPPRLQTDLPPRSHSRTPSPTPNSYMRHYGSHSTPQQTFSHMPSFSLVGALEFRQVVASLHQDSAGSTLSMFDSPVTPYAGGHYHPYHRSGSMRSARSRTPLSAQSQIPLDERPRSPRIRVTSAPESHNNSPTGSTFMSPPSDIRMSASVPTISISPVTPTDTQDDNDHLTRPPQTKWEKTKWILGGIYHTLFPSLHEFRSQSILGQIAAVFAAPAVMMLTLTLPVVVMPYHAGRFGQERSAHNLIEFEEEGVERVLIAEEEIEDGHPHGIGFNKWLIATQAILGPLFCVGVLFSGNEHQPWLFLAASVMGVSLATLIVIFCPSNSPASSGLLRDHERGDSKAFKMARCSVGFLVAIVWIMAIADEVVNVLQTFGFIFGLSDAIIGLTIFAVGNSLADLLANMSIAAFAPIMGFSACFGGPMLNILLGIGISGTYIASQSFPESSSPTPNTFLPRLFNPSNLFQTQAHIELHFGKTLFVSTIGLLSLLATTLVFVPLNGYWLSRSWGVFLICSYVVIMCINVVVELKG
ncbi:hypothetical protein K435DRAFT_651826 [Dendrothele bispora CBS 962.96]|uniref:Sodium/calcium exchanger membrane region domain-containing protein n=1 Tax=Dendrothele bispora (strain CBS 962.96) TaxID=1314807 RepID=A0A4S8MK77_DENBC|nr:hypothetical protein K435DRAFT_651826 [Dendrothele bispora CBS 962.96]